MRPAVRVLHRRIRLSSFVVKLRLTAQQNEETMTRTIRLQGDSNAHDRPWRVAVEQGFFAAEGLNVEYFEDNPKGAAGRVQDFSQRWKESQLQKGALEVYPVCEWGAIERVQSLGGGKIIGLDTTVRTGALMVREQSKIGSAADLRNIPIAVTWHAGTFYAAIEVLEAAGVPFDDIKLVHANDRLEALLSGTTEAAALMEPLVSRALAAGARKIADLRWRGGIVAGDDVDDETAGKLRRALNRAIAWLRENEARSRDELLRDLPPEQRQGGLMPELVGVNAYQPDEFKEKVDWMMDRGFLNKEPKYAEVVRSRD
jgi:ABC-type nitrate/sulfonate/bicarbonate transport system substrate-binding protein